MKEHSTDRSAFTRKKPEPTLKTEIFYPLRDYFLDPLSNIIACCIAPLMQFFTHPLFAWLPSVIHKNRFQPPNVDLRNKRILYRLNALFLLNLLCFISIGYALKLFFSGILPPSAFLLTLAIAWTVCFLARVYINTSLHPAEKQHVKQAVMGYPSPSWRGRGDLYTYEACVENAEVGIDFLEEKAEEETHTSSTPVLQDLKQWTKEILLFLLSPLLQIASYLYALYTEKETRHFFTTHFFLSRTLPFLLQLILVVSTITTAALGIGLFFPTFRALPTGLVAFFALQIVYFGGALIRYLGQGLAAHIQAQKTHKPYEKHTALHYALFGIPQDLPFFHIPSSSVSVFARSVFKPLFLLSAFLSFALGIYAVSSLVELGHALFFSGILPYLCIAYGLSVIVLFVAQEISQKPLETLQLKGLTAAIAFSHLLKNAVDRSLTLAEENAILSYLVDMSVLDFSPLYAQERREHGHQKLRAGVFSILEILRTSGEKSCIQEKLKKRLSFLTRTEALSQREKTFLDAFSLQRARSNSSSDSAIPDTDFLETETSLLKEKDIFPDTIQYTFSDFGEPALPTFPNTPREIYDPRVMQAVDAYFTESVEIAAGTQEDPLELEVQLLLYQLITVPALYIDPEKEEETHTALDTPPLSTKTIQKDLIKTFLAEKIPTLSAAVHLLAHVLRAYQHREPAKAGQIALKENAFNVLIQACLEHVNVLGAHAHIHSADNRRALKSIADAVCAPDSPITIDPDQYDIGTHHATLMYVSSIGSFFGAVLLLGAFLGGYLGGVVGISVVMTAFSVLGAASWFLGRKYVQHAQGGPYSEAFLLSSKMLAIGVGAYISATFLRSHAIGMDVSFTPLAIGLMVGVSLVAFYLLNYFRVRASKYARLLFRGPAERAYERASVGYQTTKWFVRLLKLTVLAAFLTLLIADYAVLFDVRSGLGLFNGIKDPVYRLVTSSLGGALTGPQATLFLISFSIAILVIVSAIVLFLLRDILRRNPENTADIEEKTWHEVVLPVLIKCAVLIAPTALFIGAKMGYLNAQPAFAGIALGIIALVFIFSGQFGGSTHTAKGMPKSANYPADWRGVFQKANDWLNYLFGMAPMETQARLALREGVNTSMMAGIAAIAIQLTRSLYTARLESILGLSGTYIASMMFGVAITLVVLYRLHALFSIAAHKLHILPAETCPMVILGLPAPLDSYLSPEEAADNEWKQNEDPSSYRYSGSTSYAAIQAFTYAPLTSKPSIPPKTTTKQVLPTPSSEAENVVQSAPILDDTAPPHFMRLKQHPVVQKAYKHFQQQGDPVAFQKRVYTLLEEKLTPFLEGWAATEKKTENATQATIKICIADIATLLGVFVHLHAVTTPHEEITSPQPIVYPALYIACEKRMNAAGQDLDHYFLMGIQKKRNQFYFTKVDTMGGQDQRACWINAAALALLQDRLTDEVPPPQKTSAASTYRASLMSPPYKTLEKMRSQLTEHVRRTRESAWNKQEEVLQAPMGMLSFLNTMQFTSEDEANFLIMEEYRHPLSTTGQQLRGILRLPPTEEMYSSIVEESHQDRVRYSVGFTPDTRFIDKETKMPKQSQSVAPG